MIRGGDIAKGTVLLIKGTPYLVVEREFVNPGKGSAFARCKMKNLRDGSVLTQTIKTQDNVEDATVGYDRTYHAHNQKIAVIPIGYADGFDRRLSNNFKVLVNGKFADVVGNICMDLCMIDVTNIKKVDIGTKVTILGNDGENQISIQDYAKALNTSPYEILLKFKNTRMDIIEK